MGNNHEAMDPEKKLKWTQKLTEMGIAENQIDEKLIWMYKKASHKLSALRLVLDEKGIDEAKAKEIVKKLVDHTLEKDLASIKEWRAEHEGKMEKGGECCPHCHQCHHPEEHEEK